MDQRLKTKDLVTIGVFAAIYFVGMFALGMMGMIPILFLVWPFVNGMIMGVPIMLFMAKVPKRWALFILGMIAPTIMFVMGHTYIVLVHGLVLMLIADLVRQQGECRSFKLNTLANGIFSMWACGSLMQMLLLKDQYVEMSIKMMGEEYVAALERLITWPHMALVYLGAFVGGILGGFLGRKMLKKHFEKAGIV